MGVRFECPQGHKLNVKAELAGRRGICPECGAKFVVPTESGGRVPEDTAATWVSPAPATVGGAPTTRGPIDQSRAPTTVGAADLRAGVEQPAPPTVVIGTPATPPAAPPIVWYLRPAAGGQLGPAVNSIFFDWVATGRVAPDSWVWRTGWADWKSGAETLALLDQQRSAAAAKAPVDVAPVREAPDFEMGEIGDVDDDVEDEPTWEAAAAIEPSESMARRTEVRRRMDRKRTITVFLAVATMVALIALVVALTR